jgi:hypothetical protein
MDDVSLVPLLRRLEEFRLAAEATDSRAREAREALRHVLHCYGHLYQHLTDAHARDMLRHLMGEPLERARVALGIES